MEYKMKIKCISNKDGSFTKNKIYKVRWNSVRIKDNGIGDIKIYDDDGDPYTIGYRDLPNHKFEEYKDEEE